MEELYFVLLPKSVCPVVTMTSSLMPSIHCLAHFPHNCDPN